MLILGHAGSMLVWAEATETSPCHRWSLPRLSRYGREPKSIARACILPRICRGLLRFLSFLLSGLTKESATAEVNVLPLVDRGPRLAARGPFCEPRASHVGAPVKRLQTAFRVHPSLQQGSISCDLILVSNVPESKRFLSSHQCTQRNSASALVTEQSRSRPLL